MSEGGPEVDEASATSPRGRPEAPSFKDATRFWIKLGFTNFGGPTGQFAITYEELVEKRRWVDGGHFFHALNYCMLLPGPEAQQLAVYVGWLLHGVPGGLVAGIAFILPAFFLILGLSYSYVTYGDIGWVASVFFGLQTAVVGIVAAAAIRIGARVLRNAAMVAVAAAAFAARQQCGDSAHRLPGRADEFTALGETGGEARYTERVEQAHLPGHSPAAGLQGLS